MLSGSSFSASWRDDRDRVNRKRESRTNRGDLFDKAAEERQQRMLQDMDLRANQTDLHASKMGQKILSNSRDAPLRIPSFNRVATQALKPLILSPEREKASRSNYDSDDSIRAGQDSQRSSKRRKRAKRAKAKREAEGRGEVSERKRKERRDAAELTGRIPDSGPPKQEEEAADSEGISVDSMSSASSSAVLPSGSAPPNAASFEGGSGTEGLAQPTLPHPKPIGYYKGGLQGRSADDLRALEVADMSVRGGRTKTERSLLGRAPPAGIGFLPHIERASDPALALQAGAVEASPMTSVSDLSALGGRVSDLSTVGPRNSRDYHTGLHDQSVRGGMLISERYRAGFVGLEPLNANTNPTLPALRPNAGPSLGNSTESVLPGGILTPKEDQESSNGGGTWKPQLPALKLPKLDALRKVLPKRDLGTDREVLRRLVEDEPELDSDGTVRTYEDRLNAARAKENARRKKQAYLYWYKL